MHRDMGTNRPATAVLFDADFDSPELLETADLAGLSTLLSKLLGDDYALQDLQGVVICGTQGLKDSRQTEILIDFEPILLLAYCDATTQQVELAKLTINILLQSAARYIMTSKLHIQAISDDFLLLKQEQQALAESEARYRTLAMQLEDKVHEQVEQIKLKQQQLYQVKKMAVIGQLAAGVAHEVNTPLNFIEANLVVAKDYVNSFTELKLKLQQSDSEAPIQYWQEEDLDYIVEDFPRLLAESLEGTQRVAKIVRDLKAVTLIDPEQCSVTDINSVIQSTCEVARSSIARHVEIHLVLKDVPQTLCEPALISQALLNILLNSVQALSETGGEIRVENDCRDQQLFIRVIDNGEGMSADAIENAFEPFFTTREVGLGTGLGLSVTRDIVTAHDGDIKIQSEPGKGTQVTIRLPVRDD